MRRQRVTPWRPDSTEMASGKPGAVHTVSVWRAWEAKNIVTCSTLMRH